MNQTKSPLHPHETLLRSFDFRGVTAELVEWRESLWCGKLGYAGNCTDEPDVEAVMNGFMTLPCDKIHGREENWDVCISLNYLSSDRPNGVMFGFLIDSEDQPEGCDLFCVPAARYLRIELTDDNARALGKEPWPGGIPPHEWIGELIAPALGYRYGSDSLPIVEYYGYYDPAANAHQYRYLYVPVE